MLIGAVAGRQERVISWDQLEPIGLSRKQVRTRIERGDLTVLYNDVFQVGPGRLSNNGALRAVLLAYGPHSFISHRASAAARGWRALNRRGIDVTVPGLKVRSQPGVKAHRTRRAPLPDEVVERFGLRYSSVALMLIELSPTETKQEIDRLIGCAIREGVLDLDQMARTLDRRRGDAGTARLMETTLARYLDRTDRSSNLERAWERDRAAAHQDLPPPDRNIYLTGPSSIRWEIDRYWPEHRVALELDGRPYHQQLAEMERDRIKDADLQLLGLHPLRFTDVQYEHDRDACWQTLRAFLRLQR